MKKLLSLGALALLASCSPNAAMTNDASETSSTKESNTNRIALNCLEQKGKKIENSAMWDKRNKKITLKAIEKEQDFSEPFSLIVDFKRNQALYSTEGAFFVMDIIDNSTKKIKLFFARDDELGTELLYIDLDRNALGFQNKYILDWDAVNVWERKGQCSIVSEHELNYQYTAFPPGD